jgi:regulator of sirC expression with transglutaminase-like and TPR domain
MQKSSLLGAVVAGVFAFTMSATPARSGTNRVLHGRSESGVSAPIVRALLTAPEKQIDFANAKLTIDKEVDPKIDVAIWLRRVDQMVQTIRSMAGPNASTIQKLAAVRRFIYEDGDWNGHRPFHYDLSDPLGTNIANKLLPTYIETRRGNCVSMPILFIILADRLGVHVTASTAPFHVFVKFVDDATGKTYNLETTSGGYPARDAWYRQKMPMTDDAIRNGVYMKTLSRKETVAVMAQLILENDAATGRYRDIVETADVILKYYPHDVDAMLEEGTAYARLMDEIKQKYPNPNEILPNLVPVYKGYAQENDELFDRALSLGWRDTENKMTTSQP